MSEIDKSIAEVMNFHKEGASNPDAAAKMDLITKSIQSNPAASVLTQLITQNPDPSLQAAAQKATAALDQSMGDLATIKETIPNPLGSENENLQAQLMNMQLQRDIRDMKMGNPDLFPPSPEEQQAAIMQVMGAMQQGAGGEQGQPQGQPQGSPQQLAAPAAPAAPAGQ